MKDAAREDNDDEVNSCFDFQASLKEEPVSMQLTNASNFAIVQNLMRIEKNYQTYAESHVELAQTRIEVDELRQELDRVTKEKELIQKSQTSLVGFLQDLRERMVRGASSNEMQRMIARKLVVHAKYAETDRLKPSESGESDGYRSKSHSQERSQDRRKRSQKPRVAKKESS